MPIFLSVILTCLGRFADSLQALFFEDEDQDGPNEPPPTDVRSWPSHLSSYVAEYSALLKNVSAFQKLHITYKIIKVLVYH